MLTVRPSGLQNRTTEDRERGCILEQASVHPRDTEVLHVRALVFRRHRAGAFLVVWWLGLCASTTGDMGSVPGQGTGISCASQHSQNESHRAETDKAERTEGLLHLVGCTPGDSGWSQEPCRRDV